MPEDHCPFLILTFYTLPSEICSLSAYPDGNWDEMSNVCVTSTMRSPKFCCNLEYITSFGAKEQLNWEKDSSNDTYDPSVDYNSDFF